MTKIVVILLFTSVSIISGSKVEEYVKEFEIQADCKPNSENTRSLNTGVGILYFTELTKTFLNEDFDCSYKLEAKPGFGFQVYIDYMYLRDNNLCQDFIQFGR